MDTIFPFQTIFIFLCNAQLPLCFKLACPVCSSGTMISAESNKTDDQTQV